MAGFDFWRGGDVADRDNTDSGEGDEDAVWRDLVARYDVALTAEEPVPWPEREGDPALGGVGIAGVEGAGISGVEVGRVPATGSDAGPGTGRGRTNHT